MPRTTRPRARRLTLAVVALVTVSALSACGSSADHGSMPGMGASGSSGAGSSTSSTAMTDVMFAQMMIPHHQQAVDMADLALEESSRARPEVRALAGQISKAQGPEIAQMQDWLKSWGAQAGMSMDHDMGGMMSDAEMGELEQATGAEFDRQWLTMMIEHHEGAITMAENVLMQTQNPDVEKLATAIVEGQRREIDTMKGLLA